MNESEWEMKKRETERKFLESYEIVKRLRENTIKLNKSSLWMNRIFAVVCVPLTILMVVLGVVYLGDEGWVISILYFLLALLDGCLCVDSINRISVIKRDLKHNKDELEQINSKIKQMEEMGWND